MKMEISKVFRFEAAHSLSHLPDGHKCKNLHGHSYEILIAVEGEVDPFLGWVQDYAILSAHMQPLIDMVDHKNLDVVMGEFGPTTAENLAVWFAVRLRLGLPLLSRVEVRETPTSNVVFNCRLP
jgi:6-pyruvoyltetrahydropterin/6-carboxytetrahydropterin synthase